MINLIVQFVVQTILSYDLALLSTPDGPRLTDLNTIKGDYGVPIPRVFGGATRVGATVIASNGLVEHHHDVDTGWLGDVIDFVSPISALIPKPQVYTYTTTVALLVADRTSDGPIEGISKIWANGKAIYQTGDTHSRFWKSLTIYPGSFTQTADPVLLGLGLIDGEAFRGSVVVVIEDLELTQDFGNSLPTIEFLVNAKTGQSLGELADVICAAAGIDNTRDASTTQLAGIPIGGYAIQREVNCWDALKPLLPAFEVDAAEVAGQIRFFRRGHSMRATIPADDMAGHIAADQRPEAYRLSHAPDVNLPRQVDVTFIDPSRDYQPNTQTARRSEGDAQSNINSTFALTLTADEGRAMAQTLLWGPWTGRTGNAFAVTDQWISVQPGLVYGMETPVGIRPFRIGRKTRGANGIIQLEALADDGANYGNAAPGVAGTVPGNTAVTLAAPSAPAGLAVTGGANSALLTWTANAVAEAVSAYKIYRAPGLGAVFGAAVLVKTVTGASWAEASLPASTAYTYFLKAVNAVGDSVATAGAGVTTTGLVSGGGASASIVAAGALAAGDFVNVYDNAGVLTVRKADATNPAKFANGFVLAAVLSGAAGDVHFTGMNTAAAPAVRGQVWLSETVPGGFQATAPAAAGSIVQPIGTAIPGVGIAFQPGPTFQL